MPWEYCTRRTSKQNNVWRNGSHIDWDSFYVAQSAWLRHSPFPLSLSESKQVILRTSKDFLPHSTYCRCRFWFQADSIPRCRHRESSGRKLKACLIFLTIPCASYPHNGERYSALSALLPASHKCSKDVFSNMASSESKGIPCHTSLSYRQPF